MMNRSRPIKTGKTIQIQDTDLGTGSSAPAPADRPLERALGNQIRLIRRQQDLSISDLAGAAGKKSVVLVPRGKGRYWYWGGEEQSLWYPSLRLVYQEDAGDWAPGIATAARLLPKL